MGKGLKLKKRFNSLVPGEKSKSKKARSKTSAGANENDDFEYSQDTDSDAGSIKENSDEFFHRTSTNRFGLERTWSVSALQISTHSTGNLYIDESGSDSDDSSSLESFDSGSSDDDDDLYTDDDDDEEEEDNSTEITIEAKGDKSKKKSRSPMARYKNQAKKRDGFAPEMIPEGDEDDDDLEDITEFEDITENESDDDSSPRHDDTRRASLQLPSGHSNNLDSSGHNSDSALVRKGTKLMRQQQENEGKKKKGGKKKQSSKRKEKKKGTKSHNSVDSERGGGGSLEGDSTVTTISVESEEEEDRQSNETKVEKNGKKKKKKKKKKKNGKNGKKKKKRVISFVVDGDEDACADFDKQLEEIEKFEAALVEERKLIQKERETMAFERESMEMRLDEETYHCDELNSRIRELEQLVQSQKLSNAGDDAESIDEKHALKREFAREKREFHLQLVEKEREIDKVNLALRDLKISQGSTQNGGGNSFDSNNCDGKSRERLKGELLQTVAKLSEKEAESKSQCAELESVRQQLASLNSGGGGSLELKRLLVASQEDRKRLQQELDFERKEIATKLKDKDETVTFLMNELAHLKQSKRR